MKSIVASFLFLMIFSQYCLAANTQLYSLYGKDLLTVPVIVRVKFQDKTGQSWYNATLHERQDFLLKWEANRNAASLSKEEERKQLNKLKMTIATAEKNRLIAAKQAAKVEADAKRARIQEKAENDQKISALKRKRVQGLKSLRRRQR